MAIGLYWSTVSAEGDFGIRIKVLALKLGNNHPVEKNSMTAAITSDLIISQ
jgi:hypothetical protein